MAKAKAAATPLKPPGMKELTSWDAPVLPIAQFCSLGQGERVGRAGSARLTSGGLAHSAKALSFGHCALTTSGTGGATLP
jgi:hypothetical protein